MHVIKVRNVAEALPAGVAYLLEHGENAPSRAGEVIVAPGPVTTVYSHPWERVLLSPVRDANPFFHLMEGLWVLAGREDAAFLNNYIQNYGARFAEPDGRIHDAYGYRLRGRFGHDQVDRVVQRLRDDPSDRQCVLALWDGYWNRDLYGDWKTRPCNTHIYLRVRRRAPQDYVPPVDEVIGPYLDITVCCRSNDIIWGAYGANAVQFSMLQEYLAARIGVGVGTYYQVSNNYHAYVSELERLSREAQCPQVELAAHLQLPTGQGLLTVPLVDVADCFDDELAALMGELDALHAAPDLHALDDLDIVAGRPDAKNWFLSQVAWPAAIAMRMRRLGATAAAIERAKSIIDPAWQQACFGWLERRLV